MYEVKFVLTCKGEIDVNLPFCERILCGDLDRALALAGMLRKMSMPECEYAEIIVEPFKKVNNHETKKK